MYDSILSMEAIDVISMVLRILPGDSGVYVPDLLLDSQSALKSHEDLFEIIQMLKLHPDVLRSQVEQKYFSGRNGGQVSVPPLADQHRAFNLAVRVMATANCSARYQPSGSLEFGTMPIPWLSDITLSKFMSTAFPTKNHPSLNERGQSGKFLDIKEALRAGNLKKAARLRFELTDDLRCHLKLDQKRGVVELYHDTAFLKEKLIATKLKAQDSSTVNYAEL